MKRSASKIFARGFINSFFIILVMLTVGAISYGTAMHFWNIPEAESDGLVPPRQQKEEPITEAVIDDITKNLIFHFDDETGEINSILLEIFHLEEKRMQFITIPIRTQYTMSEALYRKLVLVHPTIPQVIRLSNITKYFERDDVYDYGVLIVEDLLGVSISFYTAIPTSIYETIFVTQDFIGEKEYEATDETEGHNAGATYEVFAEEYMVYLRSIRTAAELRGYIEGVYPSFQSNLSLYDKMNYFESYSRTSLSHVSFDRIYGVNQNSAYIIDRAFAKQQVESYIAGNKGSK